MYLRYQSRGVGRTAIRCDGGSPEVRGSDPAARDCRVVVAEERSSAPGVGEVGGELGALLRHEKGLAAQPILAALLDTRDGDNPTEVRHAAERVLRADAPWALDLTGSARTLIDSAGDVRSVRLFRSWVLCGGRSLEDLARQEGISSQRVGQIVHRAESRVRHAVAGTPPWSWLVSTARRGLGALTTRDALDAVLVRLGVATSPEAELLGWLAGPYHLVPQRPGWVAVEPGPLASRTSDCLAWDGGVRRLADVNDELADLGITREQLPAWLAANGATVVHNLAVLVTGPLADAVERIVDAHGMARTSEEIEADLVAGGRLVQHAALARAVRGRRFTRSATGAVGLSVWGPEVEEGRSTKKPRRRPAKRDGSEPGPTPPQKALAPATQPRLWLWVRVDGDVLRGSEAAVPAALVEGVGLAPLARRTFSSRWGPVTLAHDGPQPTRGSVRAIALAAGARADDTLLLGFSAAGDVTVEVRRGPGQVSSPDVGVAALVLFPEFEFVNGGRP